jgi:hypothetical protein
MATTLKILPNLKKNENNGNVEKFHAIICPYIVVT